MAVNVLKLKKDAVKAGMSKDDAKKANRATLEAYLADGGSSADESAAPVKKKAAVKKSVKKSAVKKAVNKPARKVAPAAKKSAKVAGKAKRPSPAAASSSNGSGRILLGDIDFSVTSDDWTPRDGSGTSDLFKALKKARGNTEKALDALTPDVWSFVGKKMRDGTKRDKASALNMLRYRLNRTKFDFAKATGQHKSANAKNRAVYGTGAYATVRKVKPARKTTAAKSTKKGGKK